MGVSKAAVQKCDPASGYAANMSKSYWSMYGGHNCTNYAAYRLTKNGVARPSYNLGGAKTWAERAKAHGVPVTKTPARGSIGVWDGKNHLVYVEEVGNGYLITKEDNYPGYWSKGMFRTLKVYPGDRNYPQRFIHFEDLLSGAVPTVSGSPQVGQSLRAKAGVWSPGGVGLSYQWLRNGAKIAGATSSAYVASAADLNRSLSVKTTGRKKGYNSLTKTSAKTVPVAAGTLSVPAAPTIAGEPVVGAKLSAQPGSWAPQAEAFTFQWLADGKTVNTATGPTYVPTKELAKKSMSVRVTGKRNGYRSRTATSARSTPLAPPWILNRERPRVSGTPLVGSKLKVTAGSWSPKPAIYAYQWMRNGKKISGANGSSYVLTTADRGAVMSARVYVKKSGYTTRYRTSTKPPVIKTPAKVAVSAKAGNGSAALTIKVSAPGIKPLSGYVTVTEGTKTLKKVKVTGGAAAVKFTKQKLGVHTYVVTYRGTSTIAPHTYKKKVRVE